MTETTREEYEQLSRWLRETGAPSREWDRLTALYRDADRLAKLEDGIRALAESLDNDDLRLPTGSGTYRQGVDNGYNLASQHAARKIYALLDGE